MTTTAAPKGLITKLARIMAEAGKVKKEGFNSSQKYKFVQESDLVNNIRPLLAEEHVFLHQNVVKHDRVDDLTTLAVEFTWMDESGETLPPAVMVGEGWDRGDKAAAKAATAALKSFLLKSFLIGSGDDAEADERTDKAVAETDNPKLPAVAASTVGAVGRGGRTAAATRVQVNRIAALMREKQMDRESLLFFAAAHGHQVPALSGDDTKDGQAIAAFFESFTANDLGAFIGDLEAYDPLMDGGAA